MNRDQPGIYFNRHGNRRTAVCLLPSAEDPQSTGENSWVILFLLASVKTDDVSIKAPDHSQFFGQIHGHDDGDRSTESEFLPQADDELQLNAFGKWLFSTTCSREIGVMC